MWNKHKDNVVNAKGEYEKRFNDWNEELKKGGEFVERPNLNQDSAKKGLNRVAEMKDRRGIHPNNYDLYYGAHGKASTPYQKAYSREMLNPVGADDEDEAYMQANARASVADQMSKGHEILKQLSAQGMEWDDAMQYLRDTGYGAVADQMNDYAITAKEAEERSDQLEALSWPYGGELTLDQQDQMDAYENKAMNARKALERMKKTHGFKNEYDRYQFLKDAGYIR